jgi:FixJ family two-component response regulator
MTQQHARTGTVVIVDDDEGVRDALKMLAQSQGWEVHTFASAADFLESREPSNGQPTCLVVDLQMPSMDGAELVETLQSRGNKTPVIVLTAGPSGALARRARAAGVKKVVSKPFDPAQWLEAVRDVLHPVH